MFSVILAWVLLPVAAALFSSCVSEPRPKPPVMEEQRFVDFLADAYLIEGFFAAETHYHFDSLQPEMIASYDTLFAQYGISREVFDTTVLWYSHHPDIYLRVYDSVMARLTPAE